MNKTVCSQTSMTPRLTVDRNIKMPSSPDEKTSDSKPSRSPNDSDDGFNEFLQVINSTCSTTNAKEPNESVATVVSAYPNFDVLINLLY